MQNSPREHSAIILLTIIKLPFVFKTFVLSIFEWLLKTGFTVLNALRSGGFSYTDRYNKDGIVHYTF